MIKTWQEYAEIHEHLTGPLGLPAKLSLMQREIDQLREALAKQEQRSVSEQLGEPVVSYERFMGVEKELADMTAEFMRVAKELAESKQEQGEPVGYFGCDDLENLVEYPHRCRNVNVWFEGGEGLVAIYTTPQQRTWVGLTDEEIEDCYKQGGIGRAVQMLKEKNT